jgi:hypothetical protein
MGWCLLASLGPKFGMYATWSHRPAVGTDGPLWTMSGWSVWQRCRGSSWPPKFRFARRPELMSCNSSPEAAYLIRRSEIGYVLDLRAGPVGATSSIGDFKIITHGFEGSFLQAAVLGHPVLVFSPRAAEVGHEVHGWSPHLTWPDKPQRGEPHVEIPHGSIDDGLNSVIYLGGVCFTTAKHHEVLGGSEKSGVDVTLVQQPGAVILCSNGRL